MVRRKLRLFCRVLDEVADDEPDPPESSGDESEEEMDDHHGRSFRSRALLPRVWMLRRSKKNEERQASHLMYVDLLTEIGLT